MQVYVQPRVVKPTEYIIDRIPDSDPEETGECMPIAAYPFVSDKNAARLDNNPMSPAPREPLTTTVQKSLAQSIHLTRISPDHGRNKSSMRLCIGNVVNHKLHQSPLLPLHRQQPKTIQSIRWSGSHTGQVPTHEHFHSTSEHHHDCCPICSSKDDPSFRCWHFWSRGALKLTDISRMSSMSIQGAFGDSMRPSL